MQLFVLSVGGEDCSNAPICVDDLNCDSFSNVCSIPGKIFVFLRLVFLVTSMFVVHNFDCICCYFNTQFMIQELGLCWRMTNGNPIGKTVLSC